MSDKKIRSADGIEIVVGMKIVHFLEEWEQAGTVLFIDTDARYPEVVYRCHLGGRASYRPDILYASEVGLLRSKIEGERERILCSRKFIMEAEANIKKREAALSELERRVPDAH